MIKIKKMKKIAYLLVVMMLLSFSTVFASGAEVPAQGAKILTLEEAITRAKQRSKQLRLQEKKIDYAGADLEDAYYEYQNAVETSYAMADYNYSVTYANKQYEKKIEPILEEQIVYDMETQFDSILDLEERYDLAQHKLKLDTQKTQNIVRKEQLGLSSKNDVATQRTSLETQLQEIKGLEHSIQAGYRKLNDTIGGKDQKYTLIRENIYTPIDQKRTLEAYVSYGVSMDPKLWLQEETAKLQEGIIWANTAVGAPTYTEYQKRKLGYEQSVMGSSISKESKELKIKDMYENILAIEVQYEKAFPSLEEAKRQYTSLEKRYELGLIPRITLEETQLGVMQAETQINGLIRQHNQLKTLIEKPYMI